MKTPPKVVPFVRDPAPDEEDDQYTPPHVLGMLQRKNFELWISRTPEGTLSIKWWRWREDLERFFPMEDGELTLAPSELQPLAELLLSVGKSLKKGKGE